MDFLGKIFESLKEDYKSVLISIAAAFPICYLDMWMLYNGFKEFEFYPQVMLPLGGSVLFVGLGLFIYFMNIIIIDPSMDISKNFKFNPAVILIPIFFPSACLFAGIINSTYLFRICIFISCAGMLAGALVMKLPLIRHGRFGKEIRKNREEYEGE